MTPFRPHAAVPPSARPRRPPIACLRTACVSAGVSAGVLAGVLAGVASLVAPPARAEWSGGIDGGTTLGGDGGTSTLLRLDLVEDSRPFSQRVHAEWVRRGDDDEDAWRLGYVPRYHFTERLYGFGEAALRADGELGIDSEVRALAGVGTAFELPGIASLRAEIGAGAVRTTYDDDGRLDDGGDAFEDGAEVSGLGVLRAGASRAFADLVRVALDAEAEVRDAASELRADATAALRAGPGSVAVTVRTRRIDVDGGDALSVTDTFVGYSLGF